MCTTNDVDIYFKHMNNARYVRELDFARLQFCERTGLYRAILNVHGSLLQSTAYIRYRRSIMLFTPYKVTTKVIHLKYTLNTFAILYLFYSCCIGMTMSCISSINLSHLLIISFVPLWSANKIALGWICII